MSAKSKSLFDIKSEKKLDKGGEARLTAISDSLARMIERHKTAWAAMEAIPDDCPEAEELVEAQLDARDNLIATPCANSNELLVKIAYLFAYEKAKWGEKFYALEGVSVLESLDNYFNAEAFGCASAASNGDDDDPVFAAIENHRAVFQAVEVLGAKHVDGSEEYDASVDREYAVLFELAKFKPATLKGILALVEYLQTTPVFKDAAEEITTEMMKSLAAALRGHIAR